MVQKKEVENSKLYENMVVSEKNAYIAQDDLLSALQKWFLNVMEKDVADHTKIALTHGGYIQVRTVEKLSDTILNDFMNDFYFDQTWFRDEVMVDYRNVETVSVHIYEYAFIPRNINEITGNNQVDLKEEEEL